MSFPSAGMLRSTIAQIEIEKKNALTTFNLTFVPNRIIVSL